MQLPHRQAITLSCFVLDKLQLMFPKNPVYRCSQKFYLQQPKTKSPYVLQWMNIKLSAATPWNCELCINYELLIHATTEVNPQGIMVHEKANSIR